jgi:hypothetical protein
VLEASGLLPLRCKVKADLGPVLALPVDVDVKLNATGNNSFALLSRSVTLPKNALTFNTSLPAFSSLRGINLKTVLVALKALGSWLAAPGGLLDSPAMRADLPAFGLSPRDLAGKLTSFVELVSKIADEPTKGLNSLATSLSERLRDVFGCESAEQCGVQFVLTTRTAADNSTIGVLTARVKIGISFERSAPFDLQLGRLVELATGSVVPPTLDRLVDVSGSGLVGVNGLASLLLVARLDVNTNNNTQSDLGSTFDLTIANETALDVQLGAATTLRVGANLGPLTFDVSGLRDAVLGRQQVARVSVRVAVAERQRARHDEAGQRAYRPVARRIAVERRIRLVVEQLCADAAADDWRQFDEFHNAACDDDVVVVQLVTRNIQVARLGSAIASVADDRQSSRA